MARSASSPWPTASCIMVPPASDARTTVFVPMGASIAPSSPVSLATVDLTKVSIRSSVKNSKPQKPPIAS